MTDSARTDPTEIFQWRRMDHRLTTSGQPTEEQFRDIKALGVSHVINLGLHSHERALADEALTLRNLAVQYLHIPVDFDHPTDADYALFCAAMQALHDRVIHIHCIANLRVSAFLYRYRRDELAMPEAIIREDMERIWRPGGIWARFIDDAASSQQPHLYAGRDYGPA